MPATLTTHQQALLTKDMYKTQFDFAKETKPVRKEIFTIETNVTGQGDKFTQLLGTSGVNRRTAENQTINYHAVEEGHTSRGRLHVHDDGIFFSYETAKFSVKFQDIVKKFAKTMSEDLEYKKEQMAADVFNHGGDLSGYYVFDGSYIGETAPYANLPYDGVPLFNLFGNARTTKGGGTYYNSVAGISLDTTNYETILELVGDTNAVTELDRPSDASPDTILTQTLSDYNYSVRILVSSGLSGVDLNDVNPHNQNTQFAMFNMRPILWRKYLNDTSTPFYVGKRQDPTWVFMEDKTPEFNFFRDMDNGGYKANMLTCFGVHLKPGAPFRWARGGGSSA